MPTALYNTVAVLSFPVIRGLYRLSWTGLDRLPPEGGFVLAANHTSSLDPWPLGFPLWPKRQLFFMGKVELFNPVLGPILRAGGAFPVRRGEGDLEAIDAAKEICQRGRHRRDVPGGHASDEGTAQEVRAPAAVGLGADRDGSRRAARPRGGQGERQALCAFTS